MVVDTSAILAILSREPEARHFSELISLIPPVVISAATYLEAHIVAEGRWGREGVRDLKQLIASSSIAIIPFDSEQAIIASEAFSKYGRGRHPAGLDSGDCFAYALSKKTGEPLLFKGDDFVHTDVASVTHG